MQYFLKAQFHYTKNQYANLLLIIGITGSFSQVWVHLAIFTYVFNLWSIMYLISLGAAKAVYDLWSMQLTVMPLLAPRLGEQKLLVVALTGSCVHVRALLWHSPVIFSYIILLQEQLANVIWSSMHLAGIPIQHCMVILGMQLIKWWSCEWWLFFGISHAKFLCFVEGPLSCCKLCDSKHFGRPLCE